MTHRDNPSSVSISVIIPTKNRALDLARTIDTLLIQTVKPFELIIVDQSPERSFTRQLPISVHYIHDPTLPGVTSARNVAVEQAKGDIVLFLDDDVLLEPNFIEEILAAYNDNVTGVSGIITNYTTPPFRQRIWEKTFQLGPFNDERQEIYRHADDYRESAPIPVRYFTGALMSFRTSTIRSLRFDTDLKGAAREEDIDFCVRLPGGRSLLIAPKARLIHNRSPRNRDSVHWISQNAEVASYMHERYWRRGLWNNVCFGWLCVGYAIMAFFSSLKNLSFEPMQAWREGARKGRKMALGKV
jgi:glucosyl-dolichyl phosphate glucuronosyltransferase